MWELSTAANLVVALAYFAISYAILAPLARERQVRANRLGTATAAIFFSCGVGHGMHAVHALLPLFGDHSQLAEASQVVPWHEAVWDALTAAVGVYYWTLRRTYGELMRGAALFADLEHQRQSKEIEAAQAVAAAKALGERELQANAAMLRSVIENSQSLIYVKDLDGRYLLANPTFERAFSVTEAALLGQTDRVLDPDLEPVWRANDLRALDGAYQLEEWSDAPDGRRFYESSKFPLTDIDGRIYATCGISLDVTEAKRGALALENARDAAMEALGQKSAFLATMSHEIRTPMNAVIGMTGLLLDTPLDVSQREYVETVRSSGDSLLDIINDILDFSKIEAGELKLEQCSFDVRSCVDDAIDLVAATSTSAGLELLGHVEPGCPSQLVGDVTRLRQVLVNLLSNAVKFTSQGEVSLNVESGDVDGKVRLRVSVTDTGIGIPADRLAGLFDSFTQVDTSTTRLYGGTGLGLAISQRLVQAMGGALSVQSAPGMGSTFSFTVDLDHVTPVDGTPPPDAVITLEGLTALVINGNPKARNVLRLQLQGWGLSVTEVPGGAAALALVDSGTTFDVAVLDTNVVDMSGNEVAVALRSRALTRILPLMLLTSRGDNAQAETQDLFAATLTKPVRSTRLREILEQILLQDPARSVPVAPTETKLPKRGRALRVLLAEDNPTNQRIGQLMLEKLGHHVDVVGNGSEAVEAVFRLPYDVVLMDVQMPEMDGLDATRAIRRHHHFTRSQPRIVALTASALAEDQVACTEAGMDDYLSKPVRLQDLNVALEKFVRIDLAKTP